MGGGAGARTERVGSVPERLEVLTDTALIQAKVDRVTIRDDAPRQPEVVSISVDRHISVVKSTLGRETIPPSALLTGCSPTRDETCARRAAELVDVISIKYHALACRRGQVRRGVLRVAASGWLHIRRHACQRQLRAT
eukprot:COSAG02_NODE_23195_length_727_cov_0.662420_1_plen_137_part_10